MKLEKIVMQKLKELKKEYNKIIKDNKIDQNKKEIEKLDLFLRNLKEDNILLIDTNLIEEIMLTLYNKDADKNIKLFKEIQLIMQAKYFNKLNIDLTENQKNYIKELEERLILLKSQKERKNKLYSETINKEKTDELENSILEYEYLLEKIINNNKELLNEKDFSLLYETIIEDENKDYEFKKNLLIAIKEYNSFSKKENQVSLESVIEVLEKYNLTEVIELTKKNVNLLKSKARIESIEEILSFFDQKNLLNKFNDKTLFTIILFGDIDFIKEIEKKLTDFPKHKELFYKTPSFWIEDTHKRKTRRIRKSEMQGKEHNMFQNAAYEISYEEFSDNEKFLSDLGFNVSIGRETNIKTLKTASHKIKENIDYLKLYNVLDENNIDKFPASALAFSRVDDKCDMFIELGLLHGKSNYLKKSPTAINTFGEDTILLLYKLKKEHPEEEYYKIIMSEKQPDSVGIHIYVHRMGQKLKTKEEKEAFFNDNFYDYKKDIPNSEYYEEIILNNISPEISEEAKNNEFIKNMESIFKVNEYSYIIEGQTISRYKVLRCITALLKANIKITKDSLLYCILRNTYVDEKTFSLIANSNGYSLGDKVHGLFKKIQS